MKHEYIIEELDENSNSCEFRYNVKFYNDRYYAGDGKFCKTLEEVNAVINRDIQEYLANIIHHDKIVLSNGKAFDILKYDKESDVALLYNSRVNEYNVVIDINKNYDGWAYSLVYTEDYELEKEVYTVRTMENMNYKLYLLTDYLQETFSFNKLEHHNARQIAIFATAIVSKIDDIPSYRTTEEDLGIFITHMYFDNHLDKKFENFADCPIVLWSRDYILQQFESNDTSISHENYAEEDENEREL